MRWNFEVKHSNSVAWPGFVEKPGLLLLAVATAALSLIWYIFYGFSLASFLTWLASLLLAGLSMTKVVTLPDWSRFARKYALDIRVVLALIALFAPMYLLFLGSIPWQVNTDEIMSMGLLRSESSMSPDPFGVSGYHGYPRAFMITHGWFAKLLGGVNLANARAAQAASGLIIVLLCYIMFRSYMSPLYASGGSIIVGTQSAFLSISRMVLRDNMAILVTVLAFTLLLYALKKNNKILGYASGAALGLAVYTYFMGRIAIVIFMLALVLISINRQPIARRARLTGIAFASLVGFALVSSPLLISTAQNFIQQSGASEAFLPDYAKRQLLIFHDGRVENAGWLDAQSVADGVKMNIVRGLTMFNNNVRDYGRVYQNPPYGFLDKVTGILLWFGAIGMIFKRRRNDLEILVLVSFLILWLTFSFIINKAPHYNRYLLLVPFIAILAVHGAKMLSETVQKVTTSIFRQQSRTLAKYIFAVTILAIAGINMLMFINFAINGLEHGDIYGGTVRYVEERRDQPAYSYIIATGREYPYFPWDTDWISPIVLGHQSVLVVSPESLRIAGTSDFQRPFTVFMSQELWRQVGAREDYNGLRIHNIMTDGSRIAVEAP